VVSSTATRPATSLDRHIAQGHPTLHGQRPNGLAAELDRVAGPTGSADLADDRQNQVLGRDAEARLPVDANQHVLLLAQHQALGREHVLDLGGPDAEGQRPEGPVGRGVRITADQRHAGQREAGLGTDHMHDALTDVAHLELDQAELVAIAVQGLDLNARDRIGDPLGAIGGRYVVVGHREDRVRAPKRPARQAQAFEGLR
jgi:hypothetical protein